jgi:FkbM family methyltransferase
MQNRIQQCVKRIAPPFILHYYRRVRKSVSDIGYFDKITLVYRKIGFEIRRVDPGSLELKNDYFRFTVPYIPGHRPLHAAFLRRDYDFTIREPYIMIDIGLNMASTSVLFARNTWIKKIYAFEPFHETYALALQNIHANPNRDKIEAYNFGLSDSDTILRIKYHPRRSGSMSTVKDRYGDDSTLCEEIIEVQQASRVLRPILERHHEKVFLKMDCEGAEKEILPDLEKSHLLSRIDIIILEWHFENPSPLVELLERNGFLVFCSHDRPDELGMIKAVRQKTCEPGGQG